MRKSQPAHPAPLSAGGILDLRKDGAEADGAGGAGQAQQKYIGFGAIALVGCAMAAASFITAPGLAGAFGGALAVLMLATACVDARCFIIPDKLTLAAFVLGLANAANQGLGSEEFASIRRDDMLASIGVAGMRAAILVLAFLALREAYRRLRGRQGLGLGDVKLAAVAGVWLDAMSIPAAIEIAALAALGLYGVRQLVARHPFSAAARLPFGLFFAPAIWLCWLLEAMRLPF
ncbi:prepilin peptidase [Methylocapsa aurea]|uniref:prepilin peptidase n=1 Tax=Methylocapsa aurea TaxID=663610 RepID=UPI001FDA094A|nr:prepilin peptidase [Methylocapsa aurea]